MKARERVREKRDNIWPKASRRASIQPPIGSLQDTPLRRFGACRPSSHTKVTILSSWRLQADARQKSTGHTHQPVS
jgi:hypothetical protein